MHRLFVALRPPVEVRRHLLGAMGGVTEARWQDDAQLHLTLRYIGPVESIVADDVGTALHDVRAAPVTLSIAGTGAFEDRGRAISLWAGVAPRDAVTMLHRKIDHALVRAGLSPERRAYLPHVTLARLSRSAGPVAPFLADQAALSSGPFTLDHFLLYESHLGRGGATYEPVARYPLIA